MRQHLTARRRREQPFRFVQPHSQPDIVNEHGISHSAPNHDVICAAHGHNFSRIPARSSVCPGKPSHPSYTRRSIGMPKRIIILGGGFAGAYCAQHLERALRKTDAHILLLDRHNYFVFHPLLVEAGTGSLEPRHVVVPIRDFLRRAEFQMADVTAIDTAASTVTYRLIGDEQPRVLAYDHLVIALGSVTRMPPVPGLRENAFEIKNMGDAIRLRDRAIAMLEFANALDDPERRREALHFVVVGGSFTGVEVAGEFDVFLREAARRYRRINPSDCRITLVEVGDRILPALGGDLSAYALKHLRRRGLDVRLNTSVNALTASTATLNTGEVLSTRTVIWCAGIQPNPLIASLNLPTDERGWILCEPDLRVTGHSNLWGIGDCAVNPGPDGRPYPATAQHAIREAAAAARNIASSISGKPTSPCVIHDAGSLAALGCRTGVARVFGVRLAGFPAWFLWRTVYLLKMPRFSRKVRVALDWTLDLFFRRDIVQIGVTQPAYVPKPVSPPPSTPAAQPQSPVPESLH